MKGEGWGVRGEEWGWGVSLTLSSPRVPYGTRRNNGLSIWSICVKFAQRKDL